MTFCENCGTQQDSGTKFCGKCGASQAEPPVSPQPPMPQQAHQQIAPQPMYAPPSHAAKLGENRPFVKIMKIVVIALIVFAAINIVMSIRGYININQLRDIMTDPLRRAMQRHVINIFISIICFVFAIIGLKMSKNPGKANIIMILGAALFAMHLLRHLSWNTNWIPLWSFEVTLSTMRAISTINLIRNITMLIMSALYAFCGYLMTGKPLPPPVERILKKI